MNHRRSTHRFHRLLAVAPAAGFTAVAPVAQESAPALRIDVYSSPDGELAQPKWAARVRDHLTTAFNHYIINQLYKVTASPLDRRMSR